MNANVRSKGELLRRGLRLRAKNRNRLAFLARSDALNSTEGLTTIVVLRLVSYELGKVSGFGGLDVAAAHELLAILDSATSLGDLGNLKSLGLHKLKRDRRGQWAVTVNRRWRLCLEFRDGDAFDVEIVDYHRG